MEEDGIHPIDPGVLAFLDGLRMKRPLREVRCVVCRTPLTLDNLHCAIPNEGYPLFLCQDPACAQAQFGPFPRIVGWAKPVKSRRQPMHRKPLGSLRAVR